jgi:hypothetical protein
VASEIDEVIQTRLSPARLNSYMKLTSGDLSNALTLYIWNSRASAAFLEVIGAVEVVVRNSWNKQLQEASFRKTGSPMWHEKSRMQLNEYSQRDIEQATMRLEARGRRGNLDQVVAELNFGFWRFLVAKQYRTTLWPLAGKHAFPNIDPAEIQELSTAMGRLHDLRNRIAHHEPIHMRDLEKDLADCLWVVGAVCMTTRGWVEKHSRVAGVLQERPSGK